MPEILLIEPLPQALLDFDQLLALRQTLVEIVERVAAGDEAVTRGGGAVAECAADEFACELAGGERVVR